MTARIFGTDQGIPFSENAPIASSQRENEDQNKKEVKRH